MSRDGWAFLRSLEQYGGVSRLHGAFGVRQFTSISLSARWMLNVFLQSNLLYVSDPKALQHIVVKDQHIFEEPMSFLK